MGSTVFHLSGALARMGHRVTVITRREAQACKDPALIPAQDGVAVRMVKWAPLPMAFTRSYGRYALKDLLALHAEDAVDVAHLHCPMISWNAKQFAHANRSVGGVVSSLHGSWLGERDGLRRAARYGEAATWKNPNDLSILLSAGYYARFERAAVRGSDVCVANSEATLADFRSRYSPPQPWDAEAVLWGVDTEMFTPLDATDDAALEAHRAVRAEYGDPDAAALAGDADTETPLLLAVGRLVARKGFLTLLRALPAIIAENPGAHLVIVGRGHMRKTLLRQAGRLGVEAHVSIESGMPFSELAQLFRSADLVAYPSYYEGQGLIPLEAMASGTPCITVDDGPLPEMVDDEVGGLFAVGEPASLAACANELLGDAARREQMSLAGRDRVLSRFTYKRNAEDYERIYRRASEQQTD
jgi:glycosyltransferase involved in cell wall biosynthesis